MPYRIGDRLPAPHHRPLQVGSRLPVWFGFQTPPMSEVKAQAWLERRGIDAWYPTERVWRRVARGPKRKVEVIRPVVPRYVFARFTGEPQWAEVRQCRWLTRVIGTSGAPLAITEAVMLRMSEVPGRLRALRQREREARRVRSGDRVRIRDGAMSGWVVEVSAVDRGLARFVCPMLGGGDVVLPVERLDKLGIDSAPDACDERGNRGQ